MRIAFYAPLKAPDHPVPSGDRQMARLLVEALSNCGHQVELVSSLRSFCATNDAGHYERISAEAGREIERIAAAWRVSGAPQAWFTYHPYYKAPDLLGPRLSRIAQIPYFTAEASWSHRRNEGAWRETQALVAEAVGMATANLCFTARDKNGLQAICPNARLASFPPFIKPSPIFKQASSGTRLVTVAMMRPGDKLESYRMLASALEQIADIEWTLTIVGSGPAEQWVRQAFAALPSKRLHWLGEVPPHEVPAILSGLDIYVWPGFGEAYGLAYLEAGAAGLPVVAQNIAGVPEAVRDGVTGLLTEAGSVEAFASAISRMLIDPELQVKLGQRGRAFANSERSMSAAVARLNAILAEALHE
ncbi:MAG: glycosyltransferase family 4 protein [Rhizobiaceae bacterium]|nr:glycosyltransferase family 4 protein [Rhizobiaceae bacterium]